MKILLVEDDKDTAVTVRNRLRKDHVVELASTGEEADYLVYINTYDLIILDVMLPDTNGIQLCQNWRHNGIKTCILMLTGRDAIDDKVTAFRYGADDYLTKPFHFDELQARILALSRRIRQTPLNHILTVGDLTIDTMKKTVKRKDMAISLRRKEYDLLEYFMRNAGTVVTRQMILDSIWDSSYESLTNTVDVHVKYLRDRIDRPFDKKLIKTMYGLGYKLEAS